MKTAISIPEAVFQEAEALAKQLGMSRSQLYAQAVARFVETHQDRSVTEKLNEVYGAEDSALDPPLEAMQLGSLKREDS